MPWFMSKVQPTVIIYLSSGNVQPITMYPLLFYTRPLQVVKQLLFNCHPLQAGRAGAQPGVPHAQGGPLPAVAGGAVAAGTPSDAAMES
jgi:hypothetical protein